MINLPQILKQFSCDLNWTYFDKPFVHTPPSSAHDWAEVNPQEYYKWHRDLGVNIQFCQAYTFNGVALYPSRLGPNAPGSGNTLLPRLLELAHKDGVPFMSYFCVGADLFTSNVQDQWVVPGSREKYPPGLLAPESPWTDLLCARIDEFLRAFPVEALLLDWFIYGSLVPNDFLVQPAWFVEKPFEEIIGRQMPQDAAEITPAESLAYKREILARQFYRIRDTVHQASPGTIFGFNVPYWTAAEALWVDHPMLAESDFLFAESTHEDVLEWLLGIRRPNQRVMTTIIGRLDGDQCDPTSWRQWQARGCDLFGYAWGTPPDFRPHPSYSSNLEIVKRAFKEIA